MVRFPTQLVAGCFLVDVFLCDEKELGNNNLGQFESDKLAIKVYRHAHPQAQAEGILHELWEAMYDQRFSPDSTPDSEEVVRFATSSMIQLLRDNREEILRLLEMFDQSFPNLVSGVWSEVER